MIAKAARQGISKDHVFTAGHSLGGTLAEIEAAEHGLTGTTLNAYGAVGLFDGPPKAGCKLTNYVMAGDPAQAARLEARVSDALSVAGYGMAVGTTERALGMPQAEQRLQAASEMVHRADQTLHAIGRHIETSLADLSLAA